MARSDFSPSPSPGLYPTPLSDIDDSSSDVPQSPGPDVGPSASRPGSPNAQGAGKGPEEPYEGDTMSCLWEDCGEVFNHLPTLIAHIHNDHIGVHKSNYTCEWKTCPRRGIAQTSRFALISHIRSHTGEKPFICPRPECDKSFTRSDALAKHMRIQHNIIPPLPGRGGNRKRKREREDPDAQQANADGYSSFRVDHAHHDLHGDNEEGRMSPFDTNGLPHPFTNGASSLRPISPDISDDEEDEIPSHLMAYMDPQTGLIMGRTPWMVKYLIMKAKYQFALEEHTNLIAELRTLRQEEKAWRVRKDALLDQVLLELFGNKAEDLDLIMPVDLVAETANYHQQQREVEINDPLTS